MNIKPIETIYKGYRFRSRLEARWAVLLDAINAQWEYEPEGFDLGNGIKYLPDFRVNNVYIKYPEGNPITLYIEVKGILTKEDEIKINKFASCFQNDAFCCYTPENPILIVGEIPKGDDTYALICDSRCKYPMEKLNSMFFNFDLVDGDSYSAMLGISKTGDTIIYGSDQTEYVDDEKTIKAYNKARQARFEHGEKP
jgi:hypothetical protein